MTVDVWMQHPTLRHANHEMFDSLRRWMGVDRFEEESPLGLTLDAMAGSTPCATDDLDLDHEPRHAFLAGNAERVFAL